VHYQNYIKLEPSDAARMQAFLSDYEKETAEKH